MQTILLANEKIDYELKISQRRTLGIEVTRQGRLRVKSPPHVPITKIEEFLKFKTNWIINKIKYAQNNPRSLVVLNFSDGEVIHLLGRKYTLRISLTQNQSIVDVGHFIFVEGPDILKIKETIVNWFTKEFEFQLSEIFSTCLSQFNQKMKTNFNPKIKVRKMYRRWGSCSVDGRIHLSHTLLTADPEHISYVIYHELSHLIHHNHSIDFYKVLSTVCPRHKELYKKLNQETIIYSSN